MNQTSPANYADLASQKRQEVAIVGIGSLIAQGRGAAGLDRVLAGESAVSESPERPSCLIAQCAEFRCRAGAAGGGDRAIDLALAVVRDALLDAAGQSHASGRPDSALDTQSVEIDLLGKWLPQVADLRRVATVFSLSKGAVHAAQVACEIGRAHV